jgi:hypothetical protein
LEGEEGMLRVDLSIGYKGELASLCELGDLMKAPVRAS